MNNQILIVQRFYYNFREGFFEYLHAKKVNFRLINSTKSRGRVTVHKTAKDRPYYENVPHLGIGKNYIIFPFLFFHILRIRPKTIISEGGQNTINNIQILMARYLFGINYIIWDLGKGYGEFPDIFFRKIYMFFYKLTLKHASNIYTYNSLGKEYFVSLGMDNAKIIVLHNTVDTNKIKALRALNHAVPPELEKVVNSDQTVFIFVGALLPSKNIEDLKILLELLGPKYTLIIVGDGEPQYRSKIHKLFENTNTIFAGYKKIDELTPYYNCASFAVLPGLGGLSINQAMAFGLPVVCRSADGAEKDLIVNQYNGYIYSDIEDAVDFIRNRKPENWKVMGKHAETILFSEHSIDKMTERFLSSVLLPV